MDGKTAGNCKTCNMNNLAFSCLALACASLLWLGQRNALEAAHAKQRVLRQELAVARATLEEIVVSATGAENLLALRRKELHWARNAVAADVSPRLTQPVPPDPAREGLWPADKPYCYLSKQYLATVGFTPFSEDAGLTSEAATLFGMSPSEQAAVDGAYADFVDRTHQLHLAHAELIQTNAAANTENHREVTYRVPALTNEFRELRGALVSSLEQTLGNSRANLFFKRAKSQLDNIYGQFGNDGYTLKYYADRQANGAVEHQLHIQKIDGRASNGYRIRFPTDATSAMWKYRHLIGDQPLLPLPEQ